jgi:streptogramin lyase
MTEFTPPSEHAGVYLAEPDVKNHPDWTTLPHVGKLGRLDPATGKWTEYPLIWQDGCAPHRSPSDQPEPALGVLSRAE